MLLLNCYLSILEYLDSNITVSHNHQVLNRIRYYQPQNGEKQQPFRLKSHGHQTGPSTDIRYISMKRQRQTRISKTTMVKQHQRRRHRRRLHSIIIHQFIVLVKITIRRNHGFNVLVITRYFVLIQIVKNLLCTNSQGNKKFNNIFKIVPLWMFLNPLYDFYILATTMGATSITIIQFH